MTRSTLRPCASRRSAWNGCSPVRPQAGAIAYFGYKAPIRSTALVDGLRTEHSVLTVPGEHFGMGKYLRVGYGPDYTLKGLARLEELLRQVAG
jgi:aspartate/methionine/tyrosine aminotransferase